MATTDITYVLKLPTRKPVCKWLTGADGFNLRRNLLVYRNGYYEGFGTCSGGHTHKGKMGLWINRFGQTWWICEHARPLDPT